MLTRYGNLSQTIENELNAVESIRDFLIYLKEDQQTCVQSVNKSLALYVESIASVEWKEMADPRTPTNSDTSEELYAVMRSTGDLRVTGDRDSTIISAVISSISDLAKMRTRHIALANERLPPRLRLLLLFMSLVLIATFLILGVQSSLVHIFLTAAVSMSAYLLYWIIEDLDHPFFGFWNIDRSPLDNLIRRFESGVSGGSEVSSTSEFESQRNPQICQLSFYECLLLARS